jgi:hypothetical protein
MSFSLMAQHSLPEGRAFFRTPYAQAMTGNDVEWAVCKPNTQ